MSNNQDSWDAITGIFYLAHIVPLKRGNSFLGPCSSGGPCQPSGLSKYHHTSAWIDSSHLPDCLCHPLPASDRTPWLFCSNLPPFLHVSAAKKDKWPPRLCSSIYGDHSQWLVPMSYWSLTILNIKFFFLLVYWTSVILFGYHQCGSPRNRWRKANRAWVVKPACQSPPRH